MRDAELKEALLSVKTKGDAERVLAMLVIRLNQVAKVYGDEDKITMKIYSIKEAIIDYFDARGYVVDRREDSKYTVLMSFDIDGLKFKLHRMFWGKRLPGRFSKRSLMMLAKGVKDWDEDKELMIAVALKLFDRLSIRKPFLI